MSIQGVYRRPQLGFQLRDVFGSGAYFFLVSEQYFTWFLHVSIQEVRNPT